MSDSPDDTNPKRGQTWTSAILPIVGVFFVLAGIAAFPVGGWVVGVSFFAVSAVLFSLGAILDLLLEIFKSLRRLESRAEKETDKK